MNQPIPSVTLRERLRLRRQGTRVDFLLAVPRRHGPIARMALWGGLVQSQLVTDPALAHAVLVEHSDAFMKGLGLSYFMRPLLGNGLLSSEGDFHRRQRRMLAPSFMPKRLADYATTIAERSEAAQRALRDGAAVDVNAVMMRLTLEIVGATLFGAEVGAEAEEVHGALSDAMAQMSRVVRSVIPIPPTWPTPGNRRGLRAVARLDRVVYGLIEERRRSGVERNDFLSMLLAARDEGGGQMTDRQVRDEAMTIFLAGHETTANALTWTFYLLARNPAARERLERELDAHLGGRTPTLADLAKLPYAMMVFKESMRLYPPAYVVARRALRDVEVAGRHIPKGHLVIINIIGMHHDPALFPDPERFDPERFTPEAEKALPKNAFLPFGAGPRVCIGNHFALMEGHLALATLAQRVRFERSPSAPPAEMEPLVTLRPKGGMPMTVHRRAIEA
ncbi:MAG: cytochrome P450 [Deltaproteobacteria bacterium]|nr:cytochrome P450 [Myxococcales bacterium]MDP3220663.1 cytochrome P450 [Deltaproteobacteria bacterium]